MITDKLTKLFSSNIFDSKRKRMFLNLIKRIPTIKRCAACRLNMAKLRVFSIEEFRKLEPEEGKELLDLIDYHNEIIVSIHTLDTKAFHEKIKEIEIKKIEKKEKTEVIDPSMSLFANVPEEDRPKKKLILHGTNEFIATMIGCFVTFLKTKEGENMVEGSFTDIAKYLSLIAVHPNGDPISWKSLNTDFSKGNDYTLKIEKKAK